MRLNGRAGPEDYASPLRPPLVAECPYIYRTPEASIDYIQCCVYASAYPP